jgi:hypothetical protein
MKYSTSRFLQQFDSPPEGDDRDDDEFVFPVQLSSPPSQVSSTSDMITSFFVYNLFHVI